MNWAKYPIFCVESGVVGVAKPPGGISAYDVCSVCHMTINTSTHFSKEELIAIIGKMELKSEELKKEVAEEK